MAEVQKLKRGDGVRLKATGREMIVYKVVKREDGTELVDCKAVKLLGHDNSQDGLYDLSELSEEPYVGPKDVLPPVA